MTEQPVTPVDPGYRDGLKHQDFKKCVLCNQGMAGGGRNLTFYRVQIEHHVLDPRAIQRAHGMELMVGSPALANIMGADEALSKVLGDDVDVLVCQTCFLDGRAELAQVMEKVAA